MNKEMKFLMYSTPQGDVNVEAVVRDETLWLTQKAMAQLFGVQVPAISKHLKNIFSEGELSEEVVVSKMEITTQHGAIEGKTQTQETQFYNLDAIISVGYRVNSVKATTCNSVQRWNKKRNFIRILKILKTPNCTIALQN